MATNAMKIPFNFKGQMNLNVNRNEIKTEVEFNKKNAPVFGGALSPLWKKDIALDAIEQEVIFDKEGNQWSINDNSKLAKNGVEIADSPTLSYAWREDDADKNVLEFISTDEIPDLDAVYDTKGGFVRIWQNIGDTSKTFVDFGNAYETKTVQLDVTQSDDKQYKWAASWITMQITYDGTTYDTVRPVLVRAEILTDSVNLTFFFPEGGDDVPYTRFLDSGNAGTLTQSASDIGKFTPFVEFGEIINKWTDNGTTRNSGVLVGTVYSRMGQGLGAVNAFTTLSFGFSWISDGVYRTFTSAQVSYIFYSVRGKRYTGGNTTQAVIVPQFVLTQTQGAGDFVNSATYTSSFTFNISNKWGITHDNITPRVSWTLLPKYFQIAGISPSDDYSCTLVTDLMGYENKPLTIDTTIDDYLKSIVTDGFGALREKYVNKAAGVNGIDVLINNGYFVGFHSIYGNLITEMNNIDNDEPLVICDNVFSAHILDDTDDCIYYTNNQGEKKKLTRQARQSRIVELYDDRYLLTNADSEFNAYDIFNKKWSKWSSDWNNRLEFKGNHRTSIPTTQTHNNGNYSGSALTLTVIASAMNPNYEVTNSPFVSTSFPQVIGYSVNLSYKVENITVTDDYQDVDVYSSIAEENAFALYKGSIKALGLYTFRTYKTLLDGLTYPTGDIVYSPCLLSQFVKSYNNLDFIVFGQNFLSTDKSLNAYRLLYNNNAIILGYMLSSMIENLKAVFVIQTSTYIVIGDKIAYVAFNGQSISGMTFLTDIKGLDYLGALPDMALFYSGVNRTIYKFTGDAILSPFVEASNIANIQSTFYLPEIQAIIISVSEFYGGNRSLVFLQDNMFEIDYGDVKRVQYDSSTKSIILTQTLKAVKIAFCYPIFTDFTSDKVKIETEFIGTGNENLSILSAWLIRLYQSDIICPTDGEITIRQNTITDKGTQVEEKKLKIHKSDWDKVTGGYYFRYQPQYQRGVGFQLEIESDFAIQSITAEIAQDTTQIAKHNI